MAINIFSQDTTSISISLEYRKMVHRIGLLNSYIDFLSLILVGATRSSLYEARAQMSTVAETCNFSNYTLCAEDKPDEIFNIQDF